MKVKEKNKYLPYLINSLIVIVIFCLILLLSKTSPFGDALALGKSDAIYQYKPMLYNFIMKLKTGTLYQFSFNNGLGNSFFFNFAYYLSSPLNLVAIFFNNPDFMFLSVILIKMSVTSLFCTFYAKSKNCSNFTSLIVTISYAFCSWLVVYYYNIMWLDTFMMFPLFQYGLEKLIAQNKPTIFILSLAYIYATNFLLAFAVLIYGLVYFIIKNFFYDKKEIKKKLKTFLIFIGSFIFSILLIAFYFCILIDVKKQMGLGFSDANGNMYLVSTIDFIKSLFYGNNILMLDFAGNTFPNIAVNTFIFLNVIYYFLNSKISSRDKAFTFIGICLVIVCIFSVKVDYIMNFFHNVVGLTYRYSYIFSFLAIMLFIENAQNYDKKDFKKMLPIIIALLLIVLLLGTKMNKLIVIFNGVSLLFCLFILFCQNEKVLKLSLSFFVIIQSLLVGYLTIPNKEENSYEKLPNNFESKPLKYRLTTIGENDYLNKNLYTNQDVTYSFTSMTYNDTLTLVNKLGYYAGKNGMSGNIHNELFNLLFNVQSSNNYYLEKIYTVNKNILDIKFSDNVKNNTEDLIKKMTDVEKIYDKVILKPTEEDDNFYYFQVDEEYALLEEKDNVEVISKGKIKLNKNASQDNLVIYKLNQDKLKKIYEILSTKQIAYTYYRDDLIEGKIQVSEDQLIFTSIPYDTNWHITIDGKEVQPVKLLNALIGIEVEPGNHTLKMEYRFDLTKPLIISIVSLTTLLGINFYTINKKKKKKAKN